MGRNTDYTEETADRICELLSQGMSLRKVCMLDGMPTRVTVMNWMDARPDFYARYARARDIGLDECADTLRDDIDNEPDVQRARLKLDYGKWYLSKLAPKKYGDKVALTGADDGPLQVNIVRFSDRA